MSDLDKSEGDFKNLDEDTQQTVLYSNFVYNAIDTASYIAITFGRSVTFTFIFLIKLGGKLFLRSFEVTATASGRVVVNHRQTPHSNN